MSASFNFAPIVCKRCNHLIWQGITESGFEVKLSTAKLTIWDELLNMRAGIATYQIHRTFVSFEATRRLGVRMGAIDPIVLATHVCSLNNWGGDMNAPDYFNRRVFASANSEEPGF